MNSPAPPQLFQSIIKKPMEFPPNSIEAIRPVAVKRRRCLAKRLGSIDPWRLMLALKSGLLAECTWALDAISILLADNSTVIYFNLDHLPGLLNVLVDHYRCFLNKIFNLAKDMELGKSLDLNKDSANDDQNLDSKDIFSLEGKTNLLDTTNFTYKTRCQKKVEIQYDEALFLIDPQCSWDTYEDFEVSTEHWQKGGGDITSHIQTCFAEDTNKVMFNRNLESKVDKTTNVKNTVENKSNFFKSSLLYKGEPVVVLKKFNFSANKVNEFLNVDPDIKAEGNPTVISSTSAVEEMMDVSDDKTNPETANTESSNLAKIESDCIKSYCSLAETNSEKACAKSTDNSNEISSEEVCVKSTDNSMEICSEEVCLKSTDNANELNSEDLCLKLADNSKEISSVDACTKPADHSKEICSEEVCVKSASNSKTIRSEEEHVKSVDMSNENSSEQVCFKSNDNYNKTNSEELCVKSSDNSNTNKSEEVCAKSSENSNTTKSEEICIKSSENSNKFKSEEVCVKSTDNSDKNSSVNHVNCDDDQTKTCSKSSEDKTDVAKSNSVSCIISNEGLVEACCEKDNLVHSNDDGSKLPLLSSDSNEPELHNKCDIDEISIKEFKTKNCDEITDSVKSTAEFKENSPRLRGSLSSRKRFLCEDLEDEAYCFDQPALCVMNDSQEMLSRRCVCVSTIIRNLSFVPGNDLIISKNPGVLVLLGRLLLLHHEHKPAKNAYHKYEKEVDANTSWKESCTSLKDKQEWWWSTLNVLRDNTLVILSNISGHLDLSPFPEEVSLPILDGLLHWVVCPSSYAQDPLPSRSPSSVLSPQRLCLETLCKLSVLSNNVDLMIATPPWSRIENLLSLLTKSLSSGQDQIMREFALILLSNISQADSVAARTIAEQSCCISYLIAFIEEAEANAFQIASSQGTKKLRDKPELMGTTPGMVQRAANTLKNLALVPENRGLFMRYQPQLLNLVMSQVMDQELAAVIADVLFYCSDDVMGEIFNHLPAL